MREQENIIIVGNGGREHAVGWKIAQSLNNPNLFFVHGNAGTAKIGRNLDIGSTDIDRIIRVAKDNKAFIIVGPEAPLEKGIVNAAKEAGLRIFGPTKEAARLETSKWWAIEFMRRHDIPHPKSVIFTVPQKAEDFFEKNPVWNEMVIKADGLASGKGVFLPSSKEEALETIKRIMIDREFDDGSKVIIQERLKGKEVSLLAITDGKTVVPLLPAQDYKRLKDGDKGPNTGGMGAFAPAPMSSELLKQVYDTILRPTVNGTREEGNLFQGVLYVGLMLTGDGPKVLEFNVRFGDPETQPLMMLLESDLFTALKNTTKGELNRKDIVFRKGAAICVVLAAEGYPGKPRTGDKIYGLEKINGPDIQAFHAGTKLENGKVVTDGGRIVGITAYGKDNVDARRKLYPLIGNDGVYFRGMQVRREIGL